VVSSSSEVDGGCAVVVAVTQAQMIERSFASYPTQGELRAT
jgi:hypothetical protein